MTTEQWRSIPDYPLYSVSDAGQLRREGVGERAGGPLALIRNPYGYMSVSVYNAHGGKRRRVCTLVLEAFVGPRPQGLQCDHINGIRDDDRLANLRWVTPRDNNLNTVRRHGGTPWQFGARNHESVLCDAQARLAVACRAMGIPHGWTGILGAAWGVTAENVRRIGAGKRWTHIGRMTAK